MSFQPLVSGDRWGFYRASQTSPFVPTAGSTVDRLSYAYERTNMNSLPEPFMRTVLKQDKTIPNINVAQYTE